MSFHPPAPAPQPDWHAVIEAADLQAKGRAIVRVEQKQIALFATGGRVYACNNRCPHEGYPLVEGTLEGACQLTCQWHNWSFALDTGANRYGGDRLRVYPTRIADGRVWVDVADPPAAQRIEAATANLREAFADADAPRIARELARLQKAGGDPLDTVRQAIVWSHDRLEDGVTHAYAAAAGWLQLRDEVNEEDARLVCLGEAIDHMAWDTLRQPLFAYEPTVADYRAPTLLQAIEAKDEAAAVAQVRGALARGLGFAALEPVFARAALAHYAGFGHVAIYTVMTGRLIARLGAAVETPLLFALTRYLVRARREDLIPDFRDYANALAAWPTTPAASRLVDEPGAALVGASIKRALAQTLELATRHAPLAVHRALLDAAAVQLLHFDARYEHQASDNVADNVGWLDFTHALTFGNAVRVLCSRAPELWSQGLLQMALFVGRNSGFLSAAAQASAPRWQVTDARQFDDACRAQILDHGIEPPIYPAHWLKTWLAVREEIDAGAPPMLAAHLRAALNRFLHAPLKQKNSLGYARQALRFVARED